MLPRLDYGDILDAHAAATTFRHLDAVSVLTEFITADSYWTHHCQLYEMVECLSLLSRRP